MGKESRTLLWVGIGVVVVIGLLLALQALAPAISMSQMQHP